MRYFCHRSNDLRSTRRDLLDGLRKEYASAEVTGWGEQDDQMWWFDVELGEPLDVKVRSKLAILAIQMAEQAKALEEQKIREKMRLNMYTLTPDQQQLVRELLTRLDE